MKPGLEKELPDEPDLNTVYGLVEGLERQAAVLVSVATGGPRIETVQVQYRERRLELLPALERRGLRYPFPWADLWEWYGYWSANLSGYAARRQRIRQLLRPTLEALELQHSSLSITDPGGHNEPATWADLDGRVAGLALELADVAPSAEQPAAWFLAKPLGRRSPTQVVQSRHRSVPGGAVPSTDSMAAYVPAYPHASPDVRARTALRACVHVRPPSPEKQLGATSEG
jgi:hypothetical protein